MKAILALLALVALSALAATVEGNSITLDDAEAALCAEEGGCMLVTRKVLLKMRDAAMRCGA